MNKNNQLHDAHVKAYIQKKQKQKGEVYKKYERRKKSTNKESHG
jgi:hypothetical protein